jgi:outer membrane protein assembly factor BamB/predicted phosphodiesterase
MAALLLFSVTAWGASFRFLHITDTHIGLTAHHQETRDYIQAFNALTPPPAFIVNTGDCTELGSTEEYKRYREIMSELRIPLINVPGNHDVRWSAIGKEGFAKWLGPLRMHWEREGCHFFALDSTALLEHHGHFEEADLRWLEQRLRRLPRGAPVFLFFHHWVAMGEKMVDNEHRLLDIIAPYNVKAVFVGHGHKDTTWWRNGVLFLMARGLYQGSYHQVEVDASNIRIWRVTQQNAQPILLAELPRAPQPIPHLRVRGVRLQGDALLARLQWRAPKGEQPEQWQSRIGHREWRHVIAEGGGSSFTVRLPLAEVVPGTHRVDFRAIYEEKPYEVSVLVQVPGAIRPLWTFRTGGSVKAQPVVYNGTVYISSFDGTLYAVNIASGKLRWKTPVGGTLVAAPAVTEDVIVVGSTSGAVVCLRRSDGRLLWKTNLPPPVFASAAIEEDVVCTAAGDGKIYGLSLRDGKPLWEFQTGMFVQSRIVPVREMFIAGCWDNHVYALDARTGALRWKQKFGRSFYYAPAIGSPATDGIRLVVPSNDGVLHAMRVRTGEILWELPSASGNSFGYPSPLLQNETVYCGALGSRGLVYAIDVRTGQPRWVAETGQVLYDSGCALAQGYLFTASVNGVVYWIEENSGRVVQSYQLADGHVFCVPDTDGERFVIGSLNGTVYAFSARTLGNEMLEKRGKRNGELSHFDR